MTELITPRRGFLLKAFGLTVAGATASVPIVTLADAKSRLEHHKAGLTQAWADFYAGAR
jgi:hypothetical protein